MAALESAKLSYLQISPSPSSTLQFPSKSYLTIRILSSTPKIILKTPYHPLPLPILGKFQTSVHQQEISVEEEEEEEEEEDDKLEQIQKDENKRKQFVLNLPWAFTVADVKNFFGECGTVADVENIKKEDGKRGFAFVTMPSGEEALAVIKNFDSHNIKKEYGKRGFAFVTMPSGEEALDVIKNFDSHERLGRIIKIEYAKQFKKPTPPHSSGSPHSSETRHKLFVSNLAWKVRASNLKKFFVDFNPVSTRVVYGPSGSSAGYGFVSFASKEEAQSAVSTFNGKELFGRPIILKLSENLSDKSEINE